LTAPEVTPEMMKRLSATATMPGTAAVTTPQANRAGYLVDRGGILAEPLHLIQAGDGYGLLSSRNQRFTRTWLMIICLDRARQVLRGVHDVTNSGSLADPGR
jgi:hypothetical protein